MKKNNRSCNQWAQKYRCQVTFGHSCSSLLTNNYLHSHLVKSSCSKPKSANKSRRVTSVEANARKSGKQLPRSFLTPAFFPASPVKSYDTKTKNRISAFFQRKEQGITVMAQESELKLRITKLLTDDFF